jgi:hypothetical protein
MPENEDAERIYFMVRGQVIISPMGNTIAINQLAIHAAMDLYEVFDRRDCFEKVLKLSQHFIAKEAESK